MKIKSHKKRSEHLHLQGRNQNQDRRHQVHHAEHYHLDSNQLQNQNLNKLQNLTLQKKWRCRKQQVKLRQRTLQLVQQVTLVTSTTQQDEDLHIILQTNNIQVVDWQLPQHLHLSQSQRPGPVVHCQQVLSLSYKSLKNFFCMSSRCAV